LFIAATNRTNEHIKVDPMERIAQLIIVPIISQGWEIVENFDAETKRGTGGHGSTGTM
jgi:dUTP pyrophosphatase